MTFPLSRCMSVATASYGVYALAQPRHLGRVLTSNPVTQPDYDLLAQAFGARDVLVGMVGVLGRSERTITAGMLLRIAMDFSDGLLLGARTKDGTRALLLGVTFGWGTLNALALLIDRRGARSA